MNRLVLCDDHPVFVDALAEVLRRRGFRTVRTVTDPDQIVPVVRAYRPAACLIDRHFGAADGLDLIGPVLAASPTTRVLMVTADRDEQTSRRALAAGATGYLSKTAGVDALVEAVRAVLAGTTVVRPAPAARANAVDAEAHRLAGYLTRREWECLELMVDGVDSAGMAQRLGVSVATVRTHAQAVLTKLGVHSRLEAASFAVRHSLLPRPV